MQEVGTRLKGNRNVKAKAARESKHARERRASSQASWKCRATRHSKGANPWNTQKNKNTQMTPMKVVLHDFPSVPRHFKRKSTELDAEDTRDRTMSCYTTFRRVTRHLHRNSINIPRSSVSRRRFYVAIDIGVRLGFFHSFFFSRRARRRTSSD